MIILLILMNVHLYLRCFLEHIKSLKKNLKGIYDKSQIIGLGKNGQQILAELIEAGVLTEGSNEDEVRLNGNTSDLKNRVEEVTGVNFNDVWTVLDVNIHSILTQDKTKAVISSKTTNEKVTLVHNVPHTFYVDGKKVKEARYLMSSCWHGLRRLSKIHSLN